MTILFIENRVKTFFYEPITHLLEKDGHDIYWLVQNKNYTPKSKNLFVLPYPKETTINERIDYVEEIISVDRQQNHFQKKDQSYFYEYHTKINLVLDELQPDIVFGESTAFHELLTIELCKTKGILYLNPSTCRYPTGRFSFYKYNTLEPYLGSGEILSKEEAEATIHQIVYRTTKPDYMKKVSVSNIDKVRDKLTKISAYAFGERFNTPNPLVKISLDKQKDKNIEAWNTNASMQVEETTKINVLFPLHMQPEANIDVWGRKYRNQFNTIKEIAKNLPDEAILYVKPNPKSKYELSPEMIRFVENTNNIVHLHHTTKMDDVLPKIDLVVTITGTIAIECILSNKPVTTLVNTLNNNSKNCIFLESLTELPKIVSTVKEGVFYQNSLEEKIAFINSINTTSYKGKISDPFTDLSCIDATNITDVTRAFKTVLK